MVRRHELTDFQWEAIKDLLPGKVGDPGRTAADNRLFVNGVLFVLKTGVPWEDLPARFGKSNSVWKRCEPPTGQADESEGVHPSEPDTEGEKAIQQETISPPQRH